MNMINAHPKARQPNSETELRSGMTKEEIERRQPGRLHCAGRYPLMAEFEQRMWEATVQGLTYQQFQEQLAKCRFDEREEEALREMKYGKS